MIFHVFLFLFFFSLVVFALHRISSPRKRCRHESIFYGHLSGEWGENETHPHPRAAEAGVKVQRRPFLNVTACRDCGKVLKTNFGNDFRDAVKPFVATD